MRIKELICRLTTYFSSYYNKYLCQHSRQLMKISYDMSKNCFSIYFSNLKQLIISYDVYESFHSIFLRCF